MGKKRKKVNDPHATREAEKYTNPIPSREYIIQYLEDVGYPISREVLEKALNLTDEEQQEALRRRLKAMMRDGQLIKTRKGCYALVAKINLVRGKVIGHRDGYGFVVPEKGDKDVFLSARQMRGVFHGDRILVRVTGEDQRGRCEGILIEVLESNTQLIVGRFFVENNVAFVEPSNRQYNQDIIISSNDVGEAKTGQIVLAEIIVQPTARTRPIGRIAEVIGDYRAPGIETEVALRSYDLPHVWPQVVLDEAAAFGATIAGQDHQDRKDLRQLSFVTIDGEDAKDFDDAVYCERIENNGGWKLYVAIADVSHYVEPDSELDREALRRGTSVYFPRQVIPMLPEVLSNGLCSLNPLQDRLAMVCEMAIDKQGCLTESNFYPAVIHSHARLTYTIVANLIEGDSGKNFIDYAEFSPLIYELSFVYQALRKQREKRGAIDLDTQETKIIFNEQQKIDKIIPSSRNDAHRLIEECMLSANVAAAQLLESRGLPTLFRVHDVPSDDKVNSFRLFISELGLILGGKEQPESKDYSNVLAKAKERPDHDLIQTLLLRSLMQAEYSTDNKGHFGLAYPAYVQFTSPIRRYPDLLAHRAIKHILIGGSKKDFHYNLETMNDYAQHCSMTERRADQASRDVIAWLKCEYMLEKVGEEFYGLITSVTAFGVFVQLENIFVEGLIHVTSLENDYYQFDDLRHRLLGERSGTIYKLGDRVRVQVTRVDLEERKIDFDLLEHQPAG